MLSRCLPSLRKEAAQHVPIYRLLLHTTAFRLAEPVDYYKTLEVHPGASADTIKKQFFALSKTHHPDHNPDDPSAADRFVKISEAYNVLGRQDSRERYDREIQRSSTGTSNDSPRGSYSSAAPYGSRPASGLSRRRSQFRGPPPSFYRSGGWGSQSAKRKAQADAAASAASSAGGGADHRPGGGFGPGGSSSGFDDDVPHFDRPSHLRTQEQQQERRARQRAQGLEPDYDADNRSSVFFNFILVSSIVAFGCSLSGLFGYRLASRRQDES